MATGIGVRRIAGTSGTTKTGPLYTRMNSGSTSDIVSEVLGSNYRGRCEVFHDFLGDIGTTGGLLGLHDTSSAGAPSETIRDDVVNGVGRFALAADSEAETFGITFGDSLQIDSAKKFYFEARVTIPVAITTAQVFVMGLGSAVNTTLDSVATHAWFRLQASMDLLTEADDGTTDTDDQDTGVDLTATTFNTFVIDGWDPAKGIRYFIDNRKIDEIAAGVMVSTPAKLQPMILIQKASGVTEPAFDIDYLYCAWNRV